MTIPYTAQLIARLLRAMDGATLALATPHQFHRWPTRGIVPVKIIKDLIANERERRGRVK